MSLQGSGFRLAKAPEQTILKVLIAAMDKFHQEQLSVLKNPASLAATVQRTQNAVEIPMRATCSKCGKGATAVLLDQDMVHGLGFQVTLQRPK